MEFNSAFGSSIVLHVPGIEILPWEKLALLRYLSRTIVAHLFETKRTMTPLKRQCLRLNAIQELVLLPIVFRVLGFVDLQQVYLLTGSGIVFYSCPLSVKEHSQVRSLS